MAAELGRRPTQLDDLSMKSRSGFTMIELLMVIILVGVLSAVAIPQFLNFRRLGQVASLQESLRTLRVGIANQIQNARLRCGVSNLSTWVSPSGSSFYSALGTQLYYGRITAEPAELICTNAQIPNSNEQRFISISENERAHNVQSFIDYGPQVYYMPKNPFALQVSEVHPFCGYSAATLTGYSGSLCNYITAISGGTSCHWMYNFDTGEIHPGTNTTGINECNF